MLRHWRIIASASCMQSSRIRKQQTAFIQVCQNNSWYFTLNICGLCNDITMLVYDKVD